MKISEIFRSKNLVYSYEIFPPKPTSSIEMFYNALELIPKQNPDYISVTYGAAGGTKNRTTELASFITERFDLPALAHITCVGTRREEIFTRLEEMRAVGVQNVLALRGDITGENDRTGDFKYASELVRFIRENSDMDIGAACYPQGHVECSDIATDTVHLKQKVDAGVSFLTTQLFLDNRYFYEFAERIAAAGITVPVTCGIMPVTNKRQIERTLALSGCELSDELREIAEKYSDDKESFYRAGIEYAARQILELVRFGVRGIHLYTMNSARVAEDVSALVRPAIAAKNSEFVPDSGAGGNRE